MFKLQIHNKLRVSLRGIFMKPIQYEVRVPSGDWSPYFGHYQNQKWGLWDSDSCWCLSAINAAEDQLEWLWKNNYFNDEAKKFFQDNNYIDADGDFSLSEQFHEILCGNFDRGGTSPEAWQSFQIHGFIPRSMLNYSEERAASHPDKQSFVNDYFNVNQITKDMVNLGQESLKYINIAYQTIGSDWQNKSIVLLQQALKQAPICIGIPVPQNLNNYNSGNVVYDGGKTPQHEVELYHVDDSGKYYFFDQYIPNLKTLSPDYYIIYATQGIIYALNPAVTNAVPQPTPFLIKFWTAVMNFYNKIFTSTQIGHTK